MKQIAAPNHLFADIDLGILAEKVRSRVELDPPRLLLVDDEPRLLQSLEALLKDGGYDMDLAATGKEALDCLRSHQYDLVLLDLRLPDFGGHEIMDIMQREGMSATVIVLSGETGIDAAIGALQRGAYDYLRKPYSREALLNTVGNALGQRKLSAQNASMAHQLERSEKLYRYLVDSSPDVIYILNKEGHFSYVNDRAQQLLGLSRQELLGNHYSALVHEEDQERAYYVFHERRVGERASSNVELRLRTPAVSDHGDDRKPMVMSFNSIGMYGNGQDQRKEYYGTYGVARDITDRKRAEALISHQAYHDILTDLPNRILFKDRLGLAMVQARRKETELAVMFIDLDRFKMVNDTLGHIKGDELLQQVAARLKENMRKGDTLARLGGDEFTVFLPDLQSRNDARIVADKFLECLQQCFFLDGHEVHISASIGISIYPDDGESIDELLRHADMAMYQVKGQGKNSYSFYDSALQEASYQKSELEKNLRRAMEKGELEMYYQPQMDVANGRIVGVEGLMRWNHPQRGLLSAGEFLPYTEENGLMLPLSDWVLDVVFEDLRRWNAAGMGDLQVSFNLSPMSLERGNFYESLRAKIQEGGVSPSQIEVEITENICIRNPQYAIEQLNRLCELGISVAIDDFGTGYSSLAYLHRFPIHTIKIDQSFVREIQSEHAHFPVVLAIISIAKGLGLNLVAEGVETQVQASYLERHGCTTMQGYLFCQPVTADTLMQMLQERNLTTS